jgi:xanthine dehydrogenase YagS FAD-binding subunit
MNRFEYALPTSPAEALALLRDGREGTLAKAGGIDLLDLLKERIVAPSRLVNLLPLAELGAIRHQPDGSLALGPTVTLQRIADDAGIRARFAALAQAAGSAANPQIRNVATVGGNLCQRPRCWYFRHAEFVCLKKGGNTCFAREGESRYHAILGGGPSYIVHPSTMATALSALGASVRVAKAGAAEREIPLDKFFALPTVDEERENVLGPGELITAIRVPAPSTGGRSAYVVAKEREVYDWPLGEVAVALALRGATVERASVVLGAVAPIPWRAKGAEAALVGKRIDEASAAAAGRAAVEGARPLAHNGYKVPLTTELVRRAVLSLGEKA